jgi:hypothetical protein
MKPRSHGIKRSVSEEKPPTNMPVISDMTLRSEHVRSFMTQQVELLRTTNQSHP